MSWNHSYALDEYQIHKINTAAITESPGEANFNAKVLLKCCSDLPLLTFGYHSQLHRIYILGTCHVCKFWFRLNNIRDNRQASKDERFSETGREINKDIKKPFTDFRCSGRLSDTSNCFSPLQMLIPWSPPCLFCVSGIHRERNHGSTTSTRPITVHERTAICKSQLEPIIENPGNTRGAEQVVADSQTDYTGV